MEETEERSYTGTEKSRYKSILEQIAGDMGGGMPKMDGKIEEKIIALKIACN